MKKWWILLLAMLMLAGTACAETLYIDGGTADRVHLRASPVESASSLGLYFTGTPVEKVKTTTGGWTRVRVGSETGYIRTEYLVASPTGALGACIVDNRTSDWVNLRSGASFEADPIGRLNNGERLFLMGETASGWSYVQYGNARGYVVTDFLSLVEAAPVADTPAAAPAAVSSIVGTTADGGYIHAYDAGNGQMIYFVAMEAEPFITREDVNFDGHEDLVVTTIRGATNCYYEFFVWTGSGYVRADHPGLEGVANYVLYPEKGYVYSSANGGNAGALFEDCLMYWDGATLRLVRRAVSEGLREYRAEGASFVIVMHDRQASLTVYGYMANGDSTLLYEEVVNLNGMNTEKLEEMKQHLWTGLR